MPTTYSSPELRRAIENAGGLPGPDRRNLFYLVTCPMTYEPCDIEDCEYGPCADAARHEPDDGDGTEAEIHIAAIPGRHEPHPMPPIDNAHDWTLAVTESALMLDAEQLQELDDIQSQWLEPAEQRQARSDLVAAITTLLDAPGHERRQCQTCTKEHLSTEEDCPGCRRLMDHEAKRHEYPATAAA